MKKWAIGALLLSSSSWALAGGITVDNVWGRFSAPGMSMSGVFMDVSNQSKQADVLVGGSTAVAEKVELHNHINDNGVMRMREVPGGIAVAAGETVKLQPGGLHVMLMGLKKPLKVGDTFALTLKFKQAKPQTVTVTVQTGADKMPAAMPHQHKHGHDHHKAMPPAH